MFSNDFLVLLIEGLEYLTDVFQFNLMPNVGVPFFTHFSGSEVMTLQPEVTTFCGRLGSFGDKISLLKELGSSNAFSCSRGHTEVFINFMARFRLCIFPISLYEVIVNCTPQSLWIGSGYINLCTFRHTIIVTDHHCDGAKVVPCKLITWLYPPTYYKTMSTCLPSFDHSTMAALWLECGRRHKHEIDTFSACDPEHRRPHKK